MAEIRDLTERSFDAEILDPSRPAIVDFWGDACPACRQISPILKELAEVYAGRIQVVKVHAAENPGLSNRFGVRAMPTVIGFAGGRVVGATMAPGPRPAPVALRRIDFIRTAP